MLFLLFSEGSEKLYGEAYIVKYLDVLLPLAISSVAQSCPTLCDPMDCSMPGFPVLTTSQSLLKLMSIELVMPSYHLILCCPRLLLSSIFPNNRVFSSESVLYIRWPKYWSFNFSISLSHEYSDRFPLGWTDWISLHFKGL